MSLCLTCFHERQTMRVMTESTSELRLERVRHPFRARHLQLLQRERIGTNFVRLTLGGSDMTDFVSTGFDDHFKLVLPQDGYDKPLLPQMVDGRPLVDGPRPTMRDYTPLRWDTVAGTLTVDFALHDNGPAAQWAVNAPLGQWVGVAGPRGSLLMVSAAAIGYGIGAWTESEVVELRQERAALQASVADFERRAGRAVLNVCGEKQRLCVQVEPGLQWGNATAPFFVIKGY